MSIVLGGIALGCQAERSENPFDDFLRRHAEARGGIQQIERLRSIEIDLEIEESTFKVRGKYIANRDGFARIDVFSTDRKERLFTEAITQNGGWQLRKNETVADDLSTEGRKALEKGRVFNLYGLHELQGQGFELRWLGRQTRDGKRYWAVEEVRDGASRTVFYGLQSWLPERHIETTALHPDVDSNKVQTETFMTDYAPADGIMFARKTETRDATTGEVVQTVWVRRISVNPALDVRAFQRP